MIFIGLISLSEKESKRLDYLNKNTFGLTSEDILNKDSSIGRYYKSLLNERDLLLKKQIKYNSKQ